MSKLLNSRAEAAKALAPVLQARAAFDLTNLDSAMADRNMVAELCFGTLRFVVRLRLVAAALLDKPLQAKAADVEALLLIGLYQQMYLRVANHAAVSETVEASRMLGKPWATGLLNASLRRFAREREELLGALTDSPAWQAALPDWMAGRIRKQWPDHAQQIFDAFLARPPLTLRVDLSRIDRETASRQLQAAGIETFATPLSDGGLQLLLPAPVESLTGFNEGWLSVQDEGAQIAARLLNPAPGSRVLDACAAPGGKALHLLEWQPTIELTAMDLDAKRLQRVQQNLTRCRRSARLVEADAGDVQDWWDGISFDHILLDAPCSGSGVIRRHPDIKLLRTPEDVEDFSRRQVQLLLALWSTLAPSGTLLYATCSIFAQENQRVAQAFLYQRPDARVLPVDIEGAQQTGVGLQLLPVANRHDGFYYLLFQKTPADCQA